MSPNICFPTGFTREVLKWQGIKSSQVKSFKVGIASSGKSVQVEIETELKKPYEFELTPDVNYPTVQDVEEKLKAALTHCVNTYEKVDVSIFEERFYVSINVKDFIDTRFSGKKV